MVDFGAGSDRSARDRHGIAFAILIVIDPMVGGYAGADVGEPQPVGEGDCPNSWGILLRRHGAAYDRSRTISDHARLGLSGDAGMGIEVDLPVFEGARRGARRRCCPCTALSHPC